MHYNWIEVPVGNSVCEWCCNMFVHYQSSWAHERHQFSWVCPDLWLVVCNLSICTLCYELFFCLPHSLQEMYSKGLIPISAVKQVRALGENKFDVVTSVRTFVFRTEKEGEPLCFSVCLNQIRISFDPPLLISFKPIHSLYHSWSFIIFSLIFLSHYHLCYKIRCSE